MEARRPLCVLLLVLSAAACNLGPAMFLNSNAKDIANATKAIEAASNDAERARAYSDRGHWYSEKARYSRAIGRIAPDEYERIFELAIKDHDQAVLLAPESADAYLFRGLANYDRAALEDLTGEVSKRYFTAAESDFTMAIERDGRNARAYDMRALIYVTWGEHDKAIADFTQVMTIDAHLGKLRLAEEYCQRGSSNQRANDFDAAISDYEKSIAFHTITDSCDCQPDSPLAWIYIEQKRYDKARGVVRRARLSGRWIAPEVLELMKSAPPSTGAANAA